MRKDLFKKGIVLGVILLFIGVSTTPAIGVHSANEFVENEEDPEGYDITIWKIHPTRESEIEVKHVSYDVAMDIKAKYEQIENSGYNLRKQMKEKNEVLQSYGFLSSDDTLENYEKEFNHCIYAWHIL